VEHNQLVVQVDFQLMDIQEQLALNSKVEIQRMKVAAAVVATSVAVVAEITPVVQVDQALLHF
jgi:hypothetical protein